jgi:hypothetical protein
MQPKTHSGLWGLIGTIIYVAIILFIVFVVPALIAYAIAARAYPLPDAPMSRETVDAVLEQRATLAERLVFAFFAIIVGLALVGHLASL